jgi:hypothetical protein
MKHSVSALERVHALYILQTKLLQIAEQDLKDPDVRKMLRSDVREFEELLDEADWHYMGGTDVLESLRQIPGEMSQLLKSHAPAPQRKVVARTQKRAKRRK